MFPPSTLAAVHWVWEVVTPSQYEASHRMQDDPMVLSVAQDTVIAEVNHHDHSGPIMRMQVPVKQAPETISGCRRY